MGLLDLILLGILIGFTIFGLWLGAIHTLGSILGTFAGAFIAGLLYEPLGSWLASTFGYPNMMRIFAFIFIFLLVNRLFGFVFYYLSKVFNLLSFIPFLKTISRLLGAALGFIEGIIVIGMSLYVISRFPLSPWFTDILKASLVAPWFIKVTGFLQIFLPEMLKALKSVI